MARTSFLNIGSLLFFVLLLLLSFQDGEMVMVVEAGNKGPRLCESQSHRFKGYCQSDSNCASVCHAEGFMGGHCRGFRHRCFCTRPC